MKRPITISWLLVLLLTAICFLIPACSPASNETETQASAAAESPVPESAYPVTITDFLGSTVTIDAADRIVSLAASCTMTLKALGVEDRVVGIDASSEPHLPGVEVAGDYTGPDIEKIIALQPDVVLAANNIQSGAIDQLRELGIPTVAAEPTEWAQVAESFGMIGQITDERVRAKELAAELDNTVRDVQQQAPGQSVSCYYVLSYGEAGNWTSGEGSFINTMMEYAGGAPITAGSPVPWLEYPIEDLAAADPQCIIIGGDEQTVSDFSATAGYHDLAAVRDGNIYAIDPDLVTIPSINLIEGIEAVSDIIVRAAGAHDERSAA